MPVFHNIKIKIMRALFVICLVAAVFAADANKFAVLL